MEVHINVISVTTEFLLMVNFEKNTSSVRNSIKRGSPLDGWKSLLSNIFLDILNEYSPIIGSMKSCKFLSSYILYSFPHFT